jgi:hypothetical protein
VSHPVPAVLVALFAVAGAILAYYLARGFREGRFPLRTYSLIPPPRVSPDREPGYVYRNHHVLGFWFEGAFNLFAVLVCIVMIFILVTAH